MWSAGSREFVEGTAIGRVQITAHVRVSLIRGINLHAFQHMTLIDVIITAEYPLPIISCPKNVRRELAANDTSRTIYYSVPDPNSAASNEIAPNPAPPLQWKITPQRAIGSNSYRANDVVELTGPGKYKFASSSGGGLSQRTSCQFTVEILGNVRPIWFQFILIWCMCVFSVPFAINVILWTSSVDILFACIQLKGIYSHRNISHPVVNHLLRLF